MKGKVTKPEFVSHHRVVKSGLPPGSLEVIDNTETEEVIITLIEFNEQSFSERKITSLQEIVDCKNNGFVKWINVDGIDNSSIVEQIGKAFDIHPLTLEDIVNTDQRPKFEDYDFYDVAMMKMLYYDTELHAEQLSIINSDAFGEGWMIRIGGGKAGEVMDANAYTAYCDGRAH